MIETFVNDPATTVTAAVAPSDSSITVTSSSGFPTYGQFRIRLDDELCMVTNVSGTTWTVARGAESTGASSHVIGSTVNAFFTQGSLYQWLLDWVFGYGFKWQGIWSNLTAYSTNDVVTYLNGKYKCISSNTGDQPDTHSSQWTALSTL